MLRRADLLHSSSRKGKADRSSELSIDEPQSEFGGIQDGEYSQIADFSSPH